MTKRTGAIHWGRLFAAGFLTVCGVGGCDQGPTAPSQPELRNPAHDRAEEPSPDDSLGHAVDRIEWRWRIASVRILARSVTFRAMTDRSNRGPTLASADATASHVRCLSPRRNGNWRGVSFCRHEPFTFTVQNGWRSTCSNQVAEASPPAPILHGEFSFMSMVSSGRYVAPNEAKGDVTIDPVYQVRRPCVEAEWHATRE